VATTLVIAQPGKHVTLVSQRIAQVLARTQGLGKFSGLAAVFVRAKVVALHVQQQSKVAQHDVLGQAIADAATQPERLLVVCARSGVLA
jgi:hypothetical protein